MDQIMTAETFKLGQSAKLWNWFDRMRFDHQRHSVKDSCKVKFDQAGGSVADITAITDPAARCLTQDESPAKRRWNAKRMRRPVSCYVFTSGNMEVERKYRSHYETHFPSSKPIPQRVRAAKSIQNLTSVDTIDRQNTRTGLRTQLPWLPDGNSSCKDSRVVVTSGVNDTIPVFDDEDDRDDAMTQTCALDRWAESLPHIDSDVSDDDDDGYCCYDTHEYAKALVLPASSTTSGLDQTHSGVQPENIVQPKENESTIKEKMPNSLAADAAPLAVHTTAGRMTAESLSVESLSPLVMDCGVYLPGCRHRGRALVVAELSLLRSHLPPVSHLAQLVAYYQTVPRKSAAKNGLILLVVGRPDQSSSAFGLIEQLLCHFHERQQKCIDDVVIWSEGGAVPETHLRLSGRTCDVITSIGQLRERLAVALSLGCCGGPIAHNQHDWIAFRKIVEPFLSSCRQRSKVLYQVISSVRSQMATTSPPGAPLQIQSALEELDKLYNASSCNPDLIGLLAEGPRILQEVSNAKTRLGGDNVDARETMERCSALYAEVQRSVGRLARVCERRRAQLEKHLPSPLPTTSQEGCDDVDDGAARIGDGDSLSACRQILSWLCRKGEETLSRYHVTLADSLAAAKSQQREFQRFLILAQKQIVKGKELLEELQRDSGVTATPGSTLVPAESRDEQLAVAEDPVGSSAGRTISSSNTSILDLASSLQSQLSKFGHRLDDTRERLEDTSRCYELLDKAYEWGVEAMKLASKLKLDQQPCPPSVASHLLHQVDAFLSAADKISHSTALEDLNTLARKLDNPKLLDQCKLAQNRCQETMELLEFRRRVLTDYVKEDEAKRQDEQHQAQQRQDKDEVETNIYENVAELNASSSCEDKVDGLSNSKDYPIWKKNETGNQSVRAADDGNCVLLRVKKNSSPDALAKQQQQQPNSVLNGYPPLPAARDNVLQLRHVTLQLFFIVDQLELADEVGHEPETVDVRHGRPHCPSTMFRMAIRWIRAELPVRVAKQRRKRITRRKCQSANPPFPSTATCSAELHPSTYRCPLPKCKSQDSPKTTSNLKRPYFSPCGK
ncbi:uncharacterized protein LOC123475512 isoform X2 [Daphnia magna]|uniref:uncharacterized protein LOC123475512 isoform X2 n=1 Tax=Daphnia magna TaxID=35525 RepID=UPI001E1BB18E|nr:uncharacterized protein LOC123475512 isoform X2 [Daphnia magna]